MCYCARAHACATVNPTPTLTGSSTSSVVLPCTFTRLCYSKSNTYPDWQFNKFWCATPTICCQYWPQQGTILFHFICRLFKQSSSILPCRARAHARVLQQIQHLPSAANTDPSRGLFCSTSGCAAQMYGTTSFCLSFVKNPLSRCSRQWGGIYYKPIYIERARKLHESRFRLPRDCYK